MTLDSGYQIPRQFIDWLYLFHILLSHSLWLSELLHKTVAGMTVLRKKQKVSELISYWLDRQHESSE